MGTGMRFRGKIAGSLLLLLLIVAGILFLSKIGWWNKWVYHIDPLFLDSYAILSASDCHKMGYDVFRENPCDVRNRPHVYPSIWLLIGHTGLAAKHNMIAGATLVAAFFLLAVAVVRPGNISELLLALLFFWSPSILIGVDRANNDLVVFILVGAAVWLLFSKNIVLRSLSYLFICFSTFLKFYPAACCAVFLRHVGNRKQFWQTFIAFAIVFLLYFIWTFDDFLILLKIVPKPNPESTLFTFGAELIFNRLGYEDPPKALILLFALGMFATAFHISRKIKMPKIEIPDKASAFFLAGAGILLFCFFANSNYAYRSVFFLFLLPMFFHLEKEKNLPESGRRLIRLFFVFIGIYLWHHPMLEPLVVFLLETMHIPEKTVYTYWVIILILTNLSCWIAMTIMTAFFINLLKDSKIWRKSKQTNE